MLWLEQGHYPKYAASAAGVGAGTMQPIAGAEQDPGAVTSGILAGSAAVLLGAGCNM